MFVESISCLIMPLAVLMLSQMGRYALKSSQPFRSLIREGILGGILLLVISGLLQLLHGTIWLDGDRSYWVSGALGGLSMIALSGLNRYNRQTERMPRRRRLITSRSEQ